MKIIGGRDYYDSARGYGIDPALVYVREQKAFELDADLPSDESDTLKWMDYWCAMPSILGFCGELFPMVAVANTNSYDRIRNGVDRIADYKPEFFYDFEKFKESPYVKIVRGWRWEEEYKSFFNDWRKKDDAPFLEYEAPVFVAYCDTDNHRRSKGRGTGYMAKVITNPVLKDFGFASIKDPYTAFQEISMYLGNQLVKRDQPEPLADKYRLAGRGFDEKSFRHPTRLKDLK